MRDIGRLPVALAVVALVTILGLAGLAQLKFSAFLSDSVAERLEIVASTAARDFRAALDLGLDVESVANGAELLERARSHDPTIDAIAVFDLDGSVLHHVGDAPTGRIDAPTLEAFLVAGYDDAQDRWSVESDAHIHSGLVIESSFGTPVAGVSVSYPAAEMRGQEGQMAGALLFDAAWVGVAVVLAIAILFGGLARWRRRRAHVGADGDG